MKFNIYILAIAMFSIINYSYSQQTPVLADYHYNTLLINPAYAGFHQNSEINLSGRTFLNNVEGTPSTVNLTYHGPLNNKNVGIGGMIVNDNIGVTSKTGVYGAYAYKLNLGYNSFQNDWYYAPQALSFGIIAGVSYYKEDLLSLGLTDDPNFQNNVSATVPSVGIGIHYNSKHFYAGISSPNLLESSFSSDENNINLSSNVYINSGYRFYSSRYWLIEPSILLKYAKGAPWQLDMNFIFNYYNKIEFGVGYRTASTFNVLAGFYFSPNWRFIYNYSPSVNDSPLGHSHGISLSYRFRDGFPGKF